MLKMNTHVGRFCLLSLFVLVASCTTVPKPLPLPEPPTQPQTQPLPPASPVPTPPVVIDAPTCRNNVATTSASPTVTVKAVGDMVLGSDWPASNYPAGFDAEVERGLKQVLGDADVIFGNFEGALTTHPTSAKTPRPGTVFAFRMPPRFARLFRNSGFNVLAIANNHTFDFGETGFSDTLKNISQAGIVLVGETNKITLQKINGITIAWIGFAHLNRFNHVNDLEKLAELVNAARPIADLVVVSLQAGAEGSEALKVRDYDESFLGENRGNSFAFSRRAIDLGADLVIGHGPHVLRGMECYNGKIIAYSLGNFIGYGALSIKRAAGVSAVLEVTLTKDRKTLGYNIVPVRFNDQHLPQKDADKFAHYLINDLSRLAPLNGTVQFPTNQDGLAKYHRWLRDNDLINILKN